MATFIGSSGSDTITGGFVSAGVTRTPPRSFPGAAADSIEGGGGNDSIDAGDGNDTLNGGAGNDTLVGGGGNDVLDGGANAGEARDRLSGGLGSDTLHGAGNDDLDGGRGADLLLWTNGGSEQNVLKGGTGIDTLKIVNALAELGGFSLASTGVEIIDGGGNPLNGTAGSNVFDFTGVSVVNIPSFHGNDGSDSITGNAANESLFGGSGNDMLVGAEGDDRLDGADGNDSLIGGIGNDSLVGGVGNDLMVGGAGNDTYTIGVGDTVNELAGEGTDLVLSAVTVGLGINLENLTLTDAAAVNGTGNELANRLTGNAGNNQLSGLDGSDTLIGGAGNDLLVGGVGADLFVFQGTAGNDTITDFIDTGGAEDDRIRIAGYGAALDSFADLNISFAGGNATIDLSADVPGAGVITLFGISGGLDAADFVFA